MGTPVKRVRAKTAFADWWLGHMLSALATLVPIQPRFARAPSWVPFTNLLTVVQRTFLVPVRTLSAPRGTTD